MKEICLQSTGAVGDAVISTGLVPSLQEAGCARVKLITRSFICPLWNNLEGAEALPADKLAEDAPILDISAYLGNQFRNRNLHLVRLQAVEIKNQGGPEIFPSPDEVKLVMTKKELEEGAGTIAKISREKGGFPVVLFAPHSTTKNRNLPRATLQAVVTGLSGKVASCVLQPPKKGDLIEGATTLWIENLRGFASLLSAADAVVAVESAPAHIVNGVLQGSKDTMDELGLNTRQDKVVIVLGSGPETAIVYGSDSDYKNRVITREENACDIFCRAYGYPGQAEALRKHFNRVFYRSGNEKDESLCQFPEYSRIETAKCMGSIDPDKIIEVVLHQLDTFRR